MKVTVCHDRDAVTLHCTPTRRRQHVDEARGSRQGGQGGQGEANWGPKSSECSRFVGFATGLALFRARKVAAGACVPWREARGRPITTVFSDASGPRPRGPCVCGVHAAAAGDIGRSEWRECWGWVTRKSGTMDGLLESRGPPSSNAGGWSFVGVPGAGASRASLPGCFFLLHDLMASETSHDISCLHCGFRNKLWMQLRLTSLPCTLQPHHTFPRFGPTEQSWILTAVRGTAR